MIIDAEKLIKFTGFVSEFWRIYYHSAEDGDPITQQQAFDVLNSEFEKRYGEPRFKSFDAFRKRRDRYFG